MTDHFQVLPVGIIRKRRDAVAIEVFEKYGDALLGLDHFSHVIVFFWFHKNDTSVDRNILQVHPRGNKANPLQGVFATRSPIRPNLIGISTCTILSVDHNIIHIDKIDAFDGTPVIDLKPCTSKTDTMLEVRVPKWAD